MFNVSLKNIQAIEDASIMLDDHTIVEFTGDNSNGKSVISKVISALTSGDIRHKEVRRSLIRDCMAEGLILFETDTKSLGAIINEEQSSSKLLYYGDTVNDPENVIVREFGDAEGCDALVKAFGFRTYAKGDICLQLSPTFGSIPFVTTSGAINNDIVQDITTDRVADEFLESFSKITYPAFKNRITNLKYQRDSIQTVLDAFEAYDWKAYEDIHKRMAEVYMACCNYISLELDEIPIPNLEIQAVPYFELEPLPVILTADYIPYIEPIEKELDDYIQVLNGVCPTCGRPLTEHTIKN